MKVEISCGINYRTHKSFLPLIRQKGEYSKNIFMIGEDLTLARKVLLNFRNNRYLGVLRVSSVGEAVSFHGSQCHLASF